MIHHRGASLSEQHLPPHIWNTKQNWPFSSHIGLWSCSVHRWVLCSSQRHRCTMLVPGYHTWTQMPLLTLATEVKIFQHCKLNRLHTFCVGHLHGCTLHISTFKGRQWEQTKGHPSSAWDKQYTIKHMFFIVSDVCIGLPFYQRNVVLLIVHMCYSPM